MHNTSKLFYGIPFREPNTSEFEAAMEKYDDDYDFSNWDQYEIDLVEYDCSVYEDATDTFKYFRQWYVYITASAIEVGENEPPTKVDNMSTASKWDTMLEAFCIKMHIPYEQPGWYLASYRI